MHQRGGHRIQAFERPQGVEASQEVRGRLHHLGQGRDDRLVLLEDEDALRVVAPQAIWIGEVGDELGGRLVIHLGLSQIERNARLAGDGHVRRAVGGDAVVAHAPDATEPDDGLETKLLDAGVQVGAGTGPLGLLNDAVVHIHDVEGAVGAGLDVDRAEERIRSEDEFGARIGVLQLGDTLGLDDLGAAHEASDRLGEEEVALEVFGQRGAAEDIRTGRRGEMVQRAERDAGAAHAALLVVDTDDGPRDLEVGLHALREIMDAILHRDLEGHGPDLATWVHVPGLAVVVLAHAPRSA